MALSIVNTASKSKLDNTFTFKSFENKQLSCSAGKNINFSKWVVFNIFFSQNMHEIVTNMLQWLFMKKDYQKPLSLEKLLIICVNLEVEEIQ